MPQVSSLLPRNDSPHACITLNSQLVSLKPPTQSHVQFPSSTVPPLWHIRLQADKKNFRIDTLYSYYHCISTSKYIV